VQKSKYQNLSSTWSGVSSRLTALKSILSELKSTGTDSVFIPSATVSTSNGSFVTASSTTEASIGVYNLRVNQLAKSDTALSSSLTSDSLNSVTPGIRNLRIRSGDYETNVEVEFNSSGETNKTVMEKIRDAINNDKNAEVLSSSVNKTSSFVMDATNNSFQINLNGTITTITIASDEWSSITDYDSLFNKLVSKINQDVSGVIAEKVTTEGSDNIRLKISSINTSDYLTINSSGLDGSNNKVSAGNTLMDTLGIIAYKEKAAASLVTVSVFNPTSDTSKMSFTAKNTGYNNRLLIIADDAFTNIGLTSTILNNRYRNSDNGTTTNDSEAGFTYGTKWLESDGITVGGTVESSTNNLLNSKVQFNGLNIQRDSNSITDLIENVTVNLKSIMQSTDSDVLLSVESSTTNVREKIDSFISKFNDIYTYIKSRSNSVKGNRGIFTADTAAQGILSTLSSNATESVTGISSESLNMLSKIGISFDSTNGLSIDDEDTLTGKLSQNLSQVESLFNSSSGIASRMYSSLMNWEGTDGSISKMVTSYNTNISSVNDKIKSINTRIDKSAQVLRNKYEKLQMQLASLISTQNYFSSSITS
jgi:flagellar hook-associated protein 2